MELKPFHHALKILPEVCIGCTHCIQVCPTEALRVKDGKAQLFDNRCVDCGECMRVCPVNAIIVEQDDFEDILKYKYRVALVPSVLIGQFARDIPTRSIYSAILEQGFTHVYEAEHSTELLIDTFNSIFEDHPDEWPIISSFCPAVVRPDPGTLPFFGGKHFTHKTSLEIAALSYRRKLIDEGANPRILRFSMLLPCAAKIAAIKSPVGEEESPITGVINMDYLYGKTYKILKDTRRNTCMVPDKEQLKDVEMTWTLTRGESHNIKRRSIAIDGIHNVIEFLEKLENGDVKNSNSLN
jgi:NAD-dependent dihydropyrimidine dehydrogenase PreA subunit